MAVRLWIIIISYISLAVFLSFLALSIGPLGELSRIGGFFPNDYTPQAAVPKYNQSRASWHNEIVENVLVQADVWVIGDSFSHQQDKGYPWQEILAQQTGWRVSTFHVGQFNLPDVINATQTRQVKPKLIVFQIAERSLWNLPRWFGADCPSDADVSNRLDLPKPIGQKDEIAEVIPSLKSDPSFRIHEAARYARQRLLRMIGSSQVRQAQLTRKDLFSSRRADRILYLKDDLRNISIPGRVECAIRQLRHRASKALNAELVFAIAPNKLSIYQPYLTEEIANSPFQPSSALSNEPWFLNTIDGIAALVKDATQDVYLPDDSHWGPSGHRLLADLVLNYVINHQTQSADPT